MNSYTLGLSGSWWILSFLFFISIIFSVWAYKNPVPPLSSVRKSILIALRSIGLCLLLFAVFEPILSMVRASIKEPRLAVLVDKSLSMGMKDGSRNRAKDLSQALKDANLESLGEESIKIMSFGLDVKDTYPNIASVDSIKANQLGTNITKALSSLSYADDESSVRAAIIFTDGAVNSGANPLYELDYFGRPVYTVGIGDSMPPKDLSIQSILSNELCYAGTKVPVSITVQASGFPNNTLASLSLYDNGNIVGKQTLNIVNTLQTYSVGFTIIPSNPGIHKLTASIQPLANEITQKNNSLSEFITVLKHKRVIALFAGSPSADITFVKSILEQIPDAQVKSYIQKLGSEFYAPIPTAADIKDAESIILIGFPIAQTPQSIIQLIAKEAEQGKPLFFIASQNLDYQKLRALEPYLPFTVRASRPQEFLASPLVQEAGLTSPIMKITGSDRDKDIWNGLPPLFKTETFIEPKPETEILSTYKVGNSPIDEPLMMSRTFGGSKSIAIAGYGIYRWQLMANAPEQARGNKDIPNVLSSLIDQSLQWLGASEKEKTIKIRSVKKFYAAGETVDFTGQVYDASLNPVDNASVHITITGNGTKRELSLASSGNGLYSGSIAGLKEGDYYYSGMAQAINAKGTDNGRFTIGAESIEYQQLQMNASLLHAMADRSGGKFYTIDNVKNFINDIKKNPRFAIISTVEKSEIPLWNMVWLLTAALCAFAIEWFLRKRNGLL